MMNDKTRRFVFFLVRSFPLSPVIKRKTHNLSFNRTETEKVKDGFVPPIV